MKQLEMRLFAGSEVYLIKENKMSDLVISTIRTFVPSLVGAVMALLTGWGLELDGDFETALQAVVFALFSAVYYLVVRLVAKKYPQAEALLGVAKKPVYVESEREL